MTFLFGMPCQAYERELLDAQWEAEAHANIIGEMAISSIADGIPVKINVFCSPESVRAIKQARRAIADALRAGDSAAGTLFWKRALERAAEIDFSPLSDDEKTLLSSAAEPGTGARSIPVSFTGTASQHAFDAAPVAAAATAPGSSISMKKNANSVYTHENIRCVSDNVNLREYSVDCSKVDMFAQFMYQWEDNPKGPATVQLLPPLLTHVFTVSARFHFLHHQSASSSPYMSIIKHNTILMRGEPA